MKLSYYGYYGSQLRLASVLRDTCHGLSGPHTARREATVSAQITGTLAVCAGSCGPGHVHLVNGLYDCHRSRVPVLAIAAHIPSGEIGSELRGSLSVADTFPEVLRIPLARRLFR